MTTSEDIPALVQGSPMEFIVTFLIWLRPGKIQVCIHPPRSPLLHIFRAKMSFFRDHTGTKNSSWVWVGSFFGFWREFLRFLLKRFSMHLGGNSWFGLPIWVYNRWWHLHVFEWAHPFERSVVEGAGVRVISLRKTKPVCTCARAIVIGFVCPYNFELLSCMAFYHVRNFATHPILACVHLVICNALQFSYYSVTCRY